MKAEISKYLRNPAVWVAILAAMGVLGHLKGVLPALAYQLEEVKEIALSNADNLALQRWQYLHAKKQNAGLDAFEQVEYCGLSVQLNLKGIGCA